jgi:hypothetical protein
LPLGPRVLLPCRFSFTCRKRAWRRTFIPLPVENGPGAALLFLYLYKIPLAVEAQSCRGRPTIFAIFLAKFVSVALSLSGFTVGFAVKTGCAIVLQVKEYFYRLEQISTPLGIA